MTHVSEEAKVGEVRHEASMLLFLLHAEGSITSSAGSSCHNQTYVPGRVGIELGVVKNQERYMAVSSDYSKASWLPGFRLELCPAPQFNSDLFSKLEDGYQNGDDRSIDGG